MFFNGLLGASSAVEVSDRDGWRVRLAKAGVPENGPEAGTCAFGSGRRCALADDPGHFTARSASLVCCREGLELRHRPICWRMERRRRTTAKTALVTQSGHVLVRGWEPLSSSAGLGNSQNIHPIK